MQIEWRDCLILVGMLLFFVQLATLIPHRRYEKKLQAHLAKSTREGIPLDDESFKNAEPRSVFGFYRDLVTGSLNGEEDPQTRRLLKRLRITTTVMLICTVYVGTGIAIGIFLKVFGSI